MNYEVVIDFMDSHDKNHVYRKGDVFPRKGYEPTKDVISRYSTEKNNLKRILIKKKEK